MVVQLNIFATVEIRQQKLSVMCVCKGGFHLSMQTKWKFQAINWENCGSIYTQNGLFFIIISFQGITCIQIYVWEYVHINKRFTFELICFSTRYKQQLNEPLTLNISFMTIELSLNVSSYPLFFCFHPKICLANILFSVFKLD